MSSETIALNAVGEGTRPIGERLHDWVVTPGAHSGAFWKLKCP